MFVTNFRNREGLSDLFEEFNTVLAPVITDTFGPGLKFPTVDVVETADKFVIEADIPGIDKKDIVITSELGTITISGNREKNQEKQTKGYSKIERKTGKFERSFDLGETVDFSKAEATYDLGVLRLEISKKEDLKPKKIDININ